MKPKVSVIIPTYNRAGILPEALVSVYRQEGTGTRFDVEVIVVDDASTDATQEVIARYPKVRYVRLPVNHGPGGARNEGMKLSTGQYIAFLDDDDLWLSKKLALQVPALEAHPEVAMVYSQFVIASGGGDYVYPDSSAPSGSIFHRLLFANLWCTPAPLIRRECLDKVGGFNAALRTAEDYDLWLRLAFHFPVLFVPGIVAVYRRSSAGTFGTSLLDGSHAESLRLIVEAALARLPDTEESYSIKRQARATVELSIGEYLMAHQQAALGWRHVRAALEIWPRIVLNPRNQLSIAQVAGRYAATCATPIAEARRIWEEIRELPGGLGKNESIELRRVLAAMYWELGIAQGKGLGCRVNVRTAAHTVARAIFTYPYDPGRWGTLLRFLLRAIQRSSHDRLSGGRNEVSSHG